MRGPHLSLWLSLAVAFAADAQIVINEIADRGSSNICNGEDWIELYNTGDVTVNLGAEGYMLHDSKGVNDEEAFEFTQMAVVEAKSYLLLCCKQTISAAENTADPMSPQFGISSDDTITLVRYTQSSTNATLVSTSRAEAKRYQVIDTVALLDDSANGVDVTYSKDPTTGVFNYTSTPTPGAVNVMTRVLTQDEQVVSHKRALREQEALGRHFFNMDERGYPVDKPMDTVLNLTITMLEADYADLLQNQTYEQYQPFQNGTLTTTGGQVLLSFDSPGRLRPKGQSGLFVATCLDTLAFPFQLDFDHTNKSQTLFGVQRALLRHHADDFSFSREWAYYRMLARFGMPFLRARKVNFYINGHFHGFYTLMEAPEQEYVFERSFPDYNPDAFGLYKFKSLARGCGDYSQEELAIAQERMETDISTPPYAWERGEHKKKVEVMNNFAVGFCRDQFVTDFIENVRPDIVLAYLRHNEDCSEMLTEEGLIERDLGTEDFDNDMKEIIAKHLGPNKCTPGCVDSNLKEIVDTENWLKMFAFYSVSLSLDSLISFNNNYYLAQSGGTVDGWKIFPYDLNARQAVMCNDDICNSRLIHWSIARPTCESLESNQLVGPLLTDPELHTKYLSYVREFVDAIYGNESTWHEISTHIAEISEYAKADFWSAFGAFHDSEVDPPAEAWNNGQFPLLAIMKARTADVHAQLAALDDNTFARAPHVGVAGDNEPWETCADWRLERPNSTRCQLDCQYEGCHIPGWTVESFCDEGTGVCYHGDEDVMCRGIPEFERYTGMEDGLDGRLTYCRMAMGVPVKASECPAVGEYTPLVENTTSAASRQLWTSVLLAIVWIVAAVLQTAFEGVR